MELSIVYQDDNFLVINKPSGLITHPKNISDDQESITGLLIKQRPEMKNIGEPFIASGKEIPRAGVVHRLDKDTSGLMLVAKNNDSFFYFKRLFQERKIKKHYLALVYGRPRNSKGAISSPLGRIGLKRTTRIVGNKLIDKKEALTEYETVKNYKEYTLLEVTPKTGRTHQIRVHLNSIGTPVSGDEVYGFKKMKSPLGLTRLFLHAYKLEFTSPDDRKMVVETDLPEDLQKVLSDIH